MAYKGYGYAVKLVRGIHRPVQGSRWRQGTDGLIYPQRDWFPTRAAAQERADKLNDQATTG
jgi:hypothetical protein